MDSHDEAVPLSSEHLRQLVLESIPRFEDFEHEVENIIPLREGRNVEALARLYSIDPNERQEILEEVKSDYEDELKNLDQVEDPLDIFVRYIRWTIEMFPQGHNQHSDLVGLLQRATITFQDDPRYKSDTRYLHCWMQYAKWVEDANEIFLFLMKKNIAQNLATFYEEYSAYYERKRREAWEVLDLGVNRNAQPIRRLEKYRDRFQARLAQRQIVEADPVPQAREQMREMARGQRMMLGQKTDSDARYSAPSNVINNSSSSTSSSAAAAASSSREGRSFGNNSADSTAIPNARFSVYVEPEPASSVPRPAAATSPSPSPSTTSYIPSVRSRHRQENRQEVFKMAGTTLPMKNYVPPPSQAITVFRDEVKRKERGK
ncbi:Mad3/BUB1 homology region 1-domain-containing protein [Radiomyces spectabilis]|uniref:Mad3/BUB1 homology region 1-domain-containing protein n=1 Tax=Radiomyces spectabilis TaxID=64574 RepID=UPI00221FD51A|nr:Mad3/BUB1 homology region 1-domain-containing protein [Radiomyces spectabilis]KAI8377973.1 Mad3/BUB1 homology region 1-domain-containing protein [Radiomyces spectabilis]